MRFRLIPKSTTLGDLERRIQRSQNFLGTRYIRPISGTGNLGKATDFKFGGSHGPSEQKPIKNFGHKEACAYPVAAQCFQVPPIISGTGKTTDFKFGRYIHRVHPNKSQLIFLEKSERAWAYPGAAQNFAVACVV